MGIRGRCNSPFLFPVLVLSLPTLPGRSFLYSNGSPWEGKILPPRDTWQRPEMFLTVRLGLQHWWHLVS